MNLADDITYLKGVGPSRAKLLASELDVHTLGDMLEYLPFRYIDRSTQTTIRSLTEGDNYVVLRGRVGNIQVVSSGKHRERITADLNDGTGVIQLVWFTGVKWIKDKLKAGTTLVVIGRPTLFNGMWEMTHPEIEPAESPQQGGIGSPGAKPLSPFLPVYNTSEKMKRGGLGTRALARITETLVASLPPLPETLPDDVIAHFRLCSRTEAYRHIHYPPSMAEAEQARLRFKVEELFFLQLDYQYARLERNRQSQGQVMGRVGDRFNRFYHEKIPFPLTGAQKRVVREIRDDMRSGHQMNRLLQGDVGSGKTMVALMCMLLALDNGCQACLMAPTEILATQHYYTFMRQLEGMDIQVELLTGSVRTAEKRRIKRGLADGSVQLLIGTHALIEDDVQFANLGLVVIDEQHRFGVEQRSKLWSKAAIPPHVLVMTATPIPRTLAMTLYGDLACSVIDELPPGRQPIRTYHRLEANRPRVFHFLKQQIDQGRQVYIVYPLINESDKLELKNLYDGLEMVLNYFPRPQYQVSILHGQLTPDEKASEMDRFKQGKTHIMVATTVIEVGVDVPNATVMVIEDADHFGLSGLHQLRGRVGRGGGQSYCILMTKDELGYTARQRIQTMCATCDGFEIAEADLKLRGPGDIQGLQQSGALNLRVASIVDDEPLVRATRDHVADLLQADPTLAQHPLLQQHLEHSQNKILWGKIS